MLHNGSMSALSFKTPTPSLRGRTYYFRLRVPHDLLPVYAPKKEIVASLKTQDFNQARENARQLAIKIDQDFKEQRRRLEEQREQALHVPSAVASGSSASSVARGNTASATATVAPPPLRPFTELTEQEQERLLALYPDESLKAALDALNTPPAEDEAQARKEWQERQDLMQELEGDAYTPKQPPRFGFPASSRYKERLHSETSLFVEAAPAFLQDRDITPILETAKTFLARHGFALPPDMEADDSEQAARERRDFRALCLRLLELEWQVRRLFLAHLDGEPWADVQPRQAQRMQPIVMGVSQTVQTAPATQTTQTGAGGQGQCADADDTQEGPDNPRFSKIADDYAKEKGAGLAPSSLRAVQIAVRRFTEYVGDLPIRAYRKRAHIIRYKDALLCMPKSLPQDVARLPMPVILNRLQQGRLPQLGPDAPKLSTKTINEKYLAFVRTVFEYAVNNGYVDANPCAGVKTSRDVTGLEPDVAALPFTGEDLTRIFQQSRLYHPRHGSVGNIGNIAGTPARFLDYRWLVLLGLFTGARIEELAQLDRQDVKQEAGVWFIHIRPDMDTGRRVKNRASIRKVPLHSRLLELGFLEFAHGGSGGDGGGKLFAHISTVTSGKRSNTFSQWWRRFLGSLNLEDGDKKHFHSFRHTFKREGRNCGQLAGELLDALQGHTQQGVSANYGRDEDGKQYALPVLKEALERITSLAPVTRGLEDALK